MKTLDTIAGKMYVVMSPNGGTVTSADGLISETVEAGKQKIIIGTGAQLQLDDAAGKIVATFNSAPAKLRLLGLLGGGDSAVKKLTLEEALALANLPAGGGKMSVSLPWEAQLIVSGVPAALQAAADKGWTITVRYRAPEADSAVYNKYAACTTVDEVKAVNADYANDLTVDGAWEYPLFNLVNGSSLFRDKPSLKHAVINAPELKEAMRMLNDCPSLETVVLNVPKLSGNYTYNEWLIGGSRKVKKIIIEAMDTSTKTFYQWFSFCDSLSEFQMPYLPQLTNMGQLGFTGTQLNKESILRLLGQLPSWSSGTHEATIGIHVDHQADDEVLSAIADAESKGWTLTLQWNGTATAQTASTFGLRKPPIFAKVGSIERPDGTTEQYLAWGHYVTNAEENGYQEFASAEEANAYFGIQENF